MPAIFFDLETTDTNPIGQILNYSFILVDDALTIKAELNGEVRVSPLQLPSPGAILANRTPLLQHQERAKLCERDAMREIFEFIDANLPSRGKLNLIGYNSNKFDLLHLRTALIRNGFNPYFGGKLAYRDLLHAVRKLSCSHADFPRAAASGSDDPTKLSLSLETISTRMKLLEGPQTHHSRDDVVLTIELAKEIRHRYSLDILSFEAYEAVEWHNHARETRDISKRLAGSLGPNYDLSTPGLSTCAPWVILDANHRYALWIDLARYKAGAGERSIHWLNPAMHHFYLGAAPGDEWHSIAEQAIAEFKTINLNNFFKTSVCDIEQDIYRIDFDGIEALRQAIWEGSPDQLKKLSRRDLSVVMLRHQMANYTRGTAQDERVDELLKKYALYRYGGQCNTSKSNLSELYQPGVYSEHFHTTFSELLEDIEFRLSCANESDRTLLEELKCFYMASDINRVAGRELLKIRRVRKSDESSGDRAA
jgi:hypothetical protein